MTRKCKALLSSSIAGVLVLSSTVTQGAFASDIDKSSPQVPVLEVNQMQVLPKSATGLDPHTLTEQSEELFTVEVAFSTTGKVTGQVLRPDSSAASDTDVSLAAIASGEHDVNAKVTTNESGKFSHQFDLPGGIWTVKASVDVESGIVSATAKTTIDSQLKLTVSQPKVKSLTNTWLSMKLTDRGHAAVGTVVVHSKEPNVKSFRRIGAGTTGKDGIFKLRVRPWMKPSYKVTVKRQGASIAATEVGSTKPNFKPVKTPKGMPEPRVRFPVGNLPTGSKSNTKVRSIPKSVWKLMQGLSWRRGCVAKSRLRLVETNYIGFDGYRHRGQVVVARSIGKKAKRIFTRLYRAKFPIRRMQLVDVFGKNVHGRPGANDYKSMAADNTSAFNCRYVVGKERSRSRSPHASGRSIDINTWENPYVVGGSVFPNRAYLKRRAKHPAMFKSGSKSTKILRSAGCRWGGGYADYHHWDC